MSEPEGSTDQAQSDQAQSDQAQSGTLVVYRSFMALMINPKATTESTGPGHDGHQVDLETLFTPKQEAELNEKFRLIQLEACLTQRENALGVIKDLTQRVAGFNLEIEQLSREGQAAEDKPEQPAALIGPTQESPTDTADGSDPKSPVQPGTKTAIILALVDAGGTEGVKASEISKAAFEDPNYNDDEASKATIQQRAGACLSNLEKYGYVRHDPDLHIWFYVWGLPIALTQQPNLPERRQDFK